MQQRWRHVSLMAAVVAAGLTAFAAPAPAQFIQLFGFPSAEPPPPLPPDVVAGRLTRMGFKVVRLRRSPQGYVAEATDLAGQTFRLLVDPVDGSVLQHVALPNASVEREPRRGSIESAPPGERAPPRSRPSQQQSAQQPKGSEATAPAASSEPAPQQAAPAPAKPASPFVPKSGPGFANGVPINPLD